MARILGTGEAELEEAADAVRCGRLVAIPTETVYGLGGNAFDVDAVSRIFTVKGRPPTDPLICHVATVAEALALWDVELNGKSVVDLAGFIGSKFWPGPLTIVAIACSQKLPHAITGGSGCVGVRIPDHPVALQLIMRSGVPIAAPSANTFGHVSPTTAQHVLADLGSRDPNLLIVDGGDCAIGIESTVIKIINNAAEIEVLRRGKISISALQSALRGSFDEVLISVRDTRSKLRPSESTATSGSQEASCHMGAATMPMDGPGQLITHYSPSVPTFLVTPSSLGGAETVDRTSARVPCVVSCAGVAMGLTSTSLTHSVVLDFGDALIALADQALAYRSLSRTADVEEACRCVFDALRWTESVVGAQMVLVPLLSEWAADGRWESANIELLEAVEDRLFRAASGRVATLR